MRRRKWWDCKEGRKEKLNFSPYNSNELLIQLNTLWNQSPEVRLSSQNLSMLHTSCLQDHCTMHKNALL